MKKTVAILLERATSLFERIPIKRTKICGIPKYPNPQASAEIIDKVVYAYDSDGNHIDASTGSFNSNHTKWYADGIIPGETYTLGCVFERSKGGIRKKTLSSFEEEITWEKNNEGFSVLKDESLGTTAIIVVDSRELAPLFNNIDEYMFGTYSVDNGIEKNLNYLVEICCEILSDEPLFFLINSYTTGISATVLENILKTEFGEVLKIGVKDND